MSSELVNRTPEVRVRVIGSIQLFRNGNALDLGNPKQQAVFAHLVITEGTWISRDDLVDRVWDGHHVPDGANEDVQRKIGKIRKILDEAGFPESLPVANKRYRLVLPRSAVDFLRFRDLVKGARAVEDSGRAADLLQQSLDLTEGRPLPGLDGAKAEAFREHLTEERREVRRELERCSLRDGRHRQRLPLLKQAFAENPDDQEMAGYLMWALAGMGRSAEALAVYEKIHARLTRQGLSVISGLSEMRDRIRTGITEDDCAMLTPAFNESSAEEPGESASNGPENGTPDTEGADAETVREVRAGPSHHHEYHRIEITDGGIGQFGIVNNYDR